MPQLSSWLSIAWGIALTWSLFSLAFYRSKEPHGPDMVGQEVAGFVLPLVIGLVLSGVLMFVSHRSAEPPTIRGSVAVLSTLAVLLLEIGCYCCFVVR